MLDGSIAWDVRETYIYLCWKHHTSTSTLPARCPRPLNDINKLFYARVRHLWQRKLKWFGIWCDWATRKMTIMSPRSSNRIAIVISHKMYMEVRIRLIKCQSNYRYNIGIGVVVTHTPLLSASAGNQLRLRISLKHSSHALRSGGVGESREWLIQLFRLVNTADF